MTSIKSASKNIEIISGRAKAITEDPAAAAQAKAMLADLQKALSGAAEVVGQVEKLLDAKKTPAPQGKAP